MNKVISPAVLKLLGLFFLACVFVFAIVLTVRPQMNAPVLAAYEGILPAADCSGLKTRVTLYKDSTYMLEETYIATRDGDKYFKSIGKWEMVANRGRDIIRLNMKRGEQDYCFLVIDGRHIKPIGSDLADIAVPFDTRLIRIK